MRDWPWPPVPEVDFDLDVVALQVFGRLRRALVVRRAVAEQLDRPDPDRRAIERRTPTPERPATATSRPQFGSPP